jgi:type I restriction enzyme M protein
VLDVTAKARIGSARDRLVGNVPDPESHVAPITIALICKFMDAMDRPSEELGGKEIEGFTPRAWRTPWRCL